MKNYIIGLFTFSLGLILGWLNPIEGPLDWTYDAYASQPAHYKGPHRAAPPIKQEKEEIDFEAEESNIYTITIEEDEEGFITSIIRNLSFLFREE